MKFSIIDNKNTTYTFSFDKKDVSVDNGNLIMAMPIEQVIRNSEPWKFLKHEYIKMSSEAICCIEAICKNQVF